MPHCKNRRSTHYSQDDAGGAASTFGEDTPFFLPSKQPSQDYGTRVEVSGDRAQEENALDGGACVGVTEMRIH